jgi:hypothetical protein
MPSVPAILSTPISLLRSVLIRDAVRADKQSAEVLCLRLPEGSEAASEKGLKIAKSKRNHGRSYVLADYFRIGKNIGQKGDKVIQIVEQPAAVAA